MTRRRRYFESGALYEICIRARTGMPFPCKRVINLLIKSALGRTQRNFKVHITHFVWMSNHAHFLVICRDAKELTEFYGELQKRLTDYLKRILNLRYLELWEGGPAVIRIGDLAAAKERIAYFYANPARANLIDSIEQYPGYSSFDVFRKATARIGARSLEKVPWVRCPAIPEAPGRNLTEAQDSNMEAVLLKGTKADHRVVLFPNLWMSCFGVTTGVEIEEINREILEELRALEDDARKERISKNLRVVGAALLRKQYLMQEHTPKRRGRRIFIIARDKLIRLSYIELIKSICKRCEECYERWRCLDFSFSWPPGTFPPPLPLMANAITCSGSQRDSRC